MVASRRAGSASRATTRGKADVGTRNCFSSGTTLGAAPLAVPSAAGGSRKTEVSAAASASGGASGARRRRAAAAAAQTRMRSIFSLACWQRQVANASAAATIGGWCCFDPPSRSCEESNKYSRRDSIAASRTHEPTSPRLSVW